MKISSFFRVLSFFIAMVLFANSAAFAATNFEIDRHEKTLESSFGKSVDICTAKGVVSLSTQKYAMLVELSDHAHAKQILQTGFDADFKQTQTYAKPNYATENLQLVFLPTPKISGNISNNINTRAPPSFVM